MRLAYISALVLCAIDCAHAQVIRNYEYDPLGRLAKAIPNSGVTVCYTYDAADNRTNVSGGSCSSQAHAPHAEEDSFYAVKYHPPGNVSAVLDVLANDSDLDLPMDTLTVISVTGDSHISLSGGQVLFYGPPGNYSFSYTIKDSTNLTSVGIGYLEVIYCGWEC